MAVVADIDVDNYLLFKTNVEYKQAKFMQASKMTKRLITIFFSNPTLAPMWEHLSYKNVDKMRALLTELPYDKVIWQTKSLNIRLVTINVAPKNYFMYYSDIIPAIRFLISHWFFVSHLTYAPIWRYSTDNSENPQLDNENNQIYKKMPTADWQRTTQ